MTGRSAAAKLAALSCVAVALSAMPAHAMSLYCLESHSLNWHNAKPLLRDGGLHEFWLDTTDGEWRGRFVGGRAGIVDGGKLDIRNDGSGHRMNWVGLVAGTAEALAIDIAGEVMAFVWTRRDQSVEIGACVDTEGRTFLDGREIVR